LPAISSENVKYLESGNLVLLKNHVQMKYSFLFCCRWPVSVATMGWGLYTIHDTEQCVYLLAQANVYGMQYLWCFPARLCLPSTTLLAIHSLWPHIISRPAKSVCTDDSLCCSTLQVYKH